MCYNVSVMNKRILSKEHLGIIILLLIGIAVLAIIRFRTDKLFSSAAVEDINELERNEITVNLIGEESQMESPDFYVVEKADNSWLFCDIDAPSYGDDIYLFAGDKTWLSNEVKCDLMTVWDEKITSVVIDLSKNNYLNGRHIIPIHNTLQIVNIEADKDEFNEMHYCMEKEVICSGKITTDNVPEGIEAVIKGRGNATWTLYSKRPYSVETTQSYNTFGIGKQRKWNFLANAHDKTNLKNEIWFDLARKIGLKYTPQSKLVHLFVNGGYLGIYEVTTKVKEDSTYLPLAPSDFLLNLGGTVPEQRVEFDAKSWDVDSDEINDQPYADVKYPKELSDTRKKIIKDHLNELFAAIDGNDDDALDKMLDIDSFARLYWVQEISMNVDSATRSMYVFWDDSRGKFFTGPIWDLDYTLGSTVTKFEVDFSTPDGWKISHVGLWRGLMSHENFVKRVNEIYKECDVPHLMDESLELYRERERILTPEANLDYMENIDEERYYELDRDFTSYESYTNDTIDFFQERVDWIKGQMESGITAHATIE